MKVKNFLAKPVVGSLNYMLRKHPDSNTVFQVVSLKNKYPNWLMELRTEVVLRLKHGFELYCDGTDYLGRHLIRYREWEPLITKTIQHLLRPGDTCIDIGANVGYHTIVMSQSVQSAGLVFAFEPSLVNLSKLLRNLQLNSCGNVVLASLALSDSPGVSRLAPGDKDKKNCGLPNLRPESNYADSQPVILSVLDGLLAESLPRVRLVKIDVEGFELHVLSGMAKVLAVTDAVLCEVNPEWLNAQQLIDYMIDKGFSYVHAEPGAFENWIPLPNKFPSQACDVLFYRESEVDIHELVA